MKVFLVVMWLTLSYVNVAAIQAYYDARYYAPCDDGATEARTFTCSDPATSNSERREDLASNVFIGFIPIVGTGAAIFYTGFCQNGFEWNWPFTL